jgi:hypothetical protein
MEGMTMDIAGFLAARIDEDQAYLNSNRRHLWTERPLREVDAKRKILARHARRQADGPDECAWCSGSFVDDVAVFWPCPDVLDIAAIYEWEGADDG